MATATFTMMNPAPYSHGHGHGHGQVQMVTAEPLSPTCTHCGTPTTPGSMEEMMRAQQRIMELESQVKVLTLRATSAVEKANEYEGELRRLSNARSPLISPRTDPNYPNISETVSPSPSPLPAPSSPPRSTANRLVRLLSTRRDNIPSPLHTGSGSPAPSPLFSPGSPAVLSPLSEPDSALRDALLQEQTLRKEVESQAARKDSEIEELSTKLFEEANEMVAVERRARAKLQDRVETLEKRDLDKARRLGMLEQRVQRSERVRALLQDTYKGEESEDGASVQSERQ